MRSPGAGASPGAASRILRLWITANTRIHGCLPLTGAALSAPWRSTVGTGDDEGKA
jgi:hypothetical protein